MTIYTLNKCVTILLCTFLCSMMLSAQETIYEVSLKEQVQLSTQIVEGKVLSRESFWDDTHTHIYTRHTIKVHKVFKGQALETVEIITKGGVVELEAEVVSHSLQLNNGDLGMFVLKQKNINASKKTFQPISNAQGFYKYSIEKNKAVNSFKNIKGINTNFYSELQKHTNLNFVEVSPLSVDLNASKTNRSGSGSFSKLSLAPAITTFSNNISTAGTKSMIVINGNGFGEIKGKVGFSDANYGGYLHYDALDNQVISWSDTKIEVEIPDRAGTGTIKVTSDAGDFIESSQDLVIDFAQINLEYSNEAYQTQHIDNNGNGGNTWVMNQNFYNSDAKEAFTRAFESWSCSTGINWEISSTTTNINTNANDGVNVITFDNNMGSGTLGQCYSRYQGCYDNGEIKWYVTEMDILFNGTKNWNYSTSPPANDQVDFETVTVHELGHGHQLGHVIDTNVVMHYSVSTGESLRELSAEDLAGAIDVQSRSTTTTICSQELMTQSSCYQASLSTDEFLLENSISLFPNPTNGTLYIKNTAYLNIDKISIYNVLGKQVFVSIEKNTNSLKAIDVSSYSNGIYLVKIDSEFGSTTKKLIVN